MKKLNFKEIYPLGKYLYVMRHLPSPINPFPNTEWCKVGILTINEDSQGEFITSDRTRAMQQSGSTMDTDQLYYIGQNKILAEEIERQVHKYLKKDGFLPMQNDTGETGHSEWFKIDNEKLQNKIEMVLDFKLWMFEGDPIAIISQKLHQDETFKKIYWNNIS